MSGDDQLIQRFGREFPKGHVLFRDGEPGREMYVVQSGRVNITKAIRNAQLLLATLGPGEFFGEMAILSNKPRSAGAVMADDGRLLVIDPRNFEAMIRSNGEIAARLIKKLSERLQEADEQIENLLMRDPVSRVVHYFVRASQRRGRATSQGALVAVNLAELHSQIGLTSQEVEQAVLRASKARILLVAPESSQPGAEHPAGVVVPDVAKAMKYLEFLEMKEKFGES